MKSRIFHIEKYTFLKHKREITTSTQWTIEEDRQLLELKYQGNYPYSLISEQISTRSAIECSSRWKYHWNPNIKKGKWTQEEDAKLISYISENKDKEWHSAHQILNTRNPKQIRERFVNHININASDKIQWNREWDKELIQLYLKHGSSWVIISKYFKNASENNVKNRFYSLWRQCANKYKEVNSYLLDNKSKQKNYTVKILMNYLPELMKDLKVEYNKNNNLELRKQEGVKKIVTNLSKHLEWNDIPLCSAKVSQTKSSILLNMQLSQLGFIFDKLKTNLLHKYFLSFRKNVRDN